MGTSQNRAAAGRASSARAVGVAFAVVAAAAPAAAHAGGFTDTELSQRAWDAYLEGPLATAGSLDDVDYRELARVDDAASGVQAIALERRSDHAVVVAYAGTSSDEPVDVLADLGIAAKDARFVMTDAIAGVVDEAVRDGVLPARRAAATRASLVGRFRLPKGRAAAAHAEAARVRAKGFDPTAATEAQLAVSRRFLDDVLALQTLDGRVITVERVVLTGHSLGGFLVQIVAAERSARGVTFNAPGAQHYAPSLPRGASVRNLIRRHDVVGTFGEHLGTTEAWDDVPIAAKKGESKNFVYRNHSIAAFHATLAQAGV